MISVDDYERRLYWLQGVIFVGVAIAALPVWLVLTQFIDAEKLLPTLRNLEWVFPKLTADVARMSSRTASSDLIGPYYLAHLFCVTAFPLYLRHVIHRTSSGMDFSNPRKWRLKAEAFWVQIIGAVLFVLIVAFYSFGDGNGRIARAVTGSWVGLIWTGLLFAGLGSSATNVHLTWKARALEQQIDFRFK